MGYRVIVMKKFDLKEFIKKNWTVLISIGCVIWLIKSIAGSYLEPEYKVISILLCAIWFEMMTKRLEP